MTNRTLLLVMLIVMLLLPQALIAQVDPPEIRGAWVFGFGGEFANASATTTMINKLADNNFNIVIPEIRKSGDAYYNSAYEPWASDVAAGYDPLLDMVNKAHARNMEVYPWIVTYRIWPTTGTAPSTHIWRLHPEWAMMNTSGSIKDGSYYDLDPGVPGVQDYLSKVVIDIISNYDVDGFNFDYIRYPTYTWGYNAISKARFKSETGYDPPTVKNLSDPHWIAWSDWRRQQVTDLVKKCYLETMWRKPHVKMTVDSIGWMGVDPNVDFTGTRAYTDVFQDAKGWMEQGIIDMNILMNYKRDWMTGTPVNGYSGGDQRSDHRLWSDWLASMQASTGRQAVDGIGGYLNIMSGISTQWAYSRANGIGLCNYRYGFTVGLESSTPGIPAFASYGSGNPRQGSDTLFFSTIKSTMFQNPAPIPDMPWKTNPTAGIVFGTVTDASEPNDPTYQNWVYKATVTLTGPYPSTATQTDLTDATGTFGFMDVAPGIYTVSFSKTNFSPITGISASITAGQVARLNVQLAAPLAPGSYKTLAQANDPALMDVTIGLNGNVVTTPTGTFPDCMYIETPGRSSGLQVRFDGAAPALNEGDSVNLIGKITTIADQRVLDHATLQGRSFGTALRPLSFSGRDLGGVPPTTGLLVTTLGDITFADTDYFYIDDGSALDDGSGHLGVKVLATGLTFPSTGFAMVTGINTREMIGGQLFQRIRARKQADITVY